MPLQTDECLDVLEADTALKSVIVFVFFFFFFKDVVIFANHIKRCLACPPTPISDSHHTHTHTHRRWSFPALGKVADR